MGDLITYITERIFSPQQNTAKLVAWEGKLNKQPTRESGKGSDAKHMWDRIQKSKNVAEQTT